MTTIGDLMVQIAKIRQVGNLAGMTDLEIGKLPILEVTGKSFIPLKVSIEFAQAKGRGINNKESFIWLQSKPSGQIKAIS